MWINFHWQRLDHGDIWRRVSCNCSQAVGKRYSLPANPQPLPLGAVNGVPPKWIVSWLKRSDFLGLCVPNMPFLPQSTCTTSQLESLVGRLCFCGQDIRLDADAKISILPLDPYSPSQLTQRIAHRWTHWTWLDMDMSNNPNEGEPLVTWGCRRSQN